MKENPSQTAALIETVNAHLTQVQAAARYDADEATLRVATGSLRFLLADGNLGRAWRASTLGGSKADILRRLEAGEIEGPPCVSTTAACCITKFFP